MTAWVSHFFIESLVSCRHKLKLWLHFVTASSLPGWLQIPFIATDVFLQENFAFCVMPVALILRNRFIMQKINDPNQPPKATCLRNSLKKLKNFRILCEHCLCEQNHDLTLVRGGGWRESGKHARFLLTTLNLFHSHFSQEILFPCWQRWCFLYCQMEINDKWSNFRKTEVSDPWAADRHGYMAC